MDFFKFLCYCNAKSGSGKTLETLANTLFRGMSEAKCLMKWQEMKQDTEKHSQVFLRDTLDNNFPRKNRNLQEGAGGSLNKHRCKKRFKHICTLSHYFFLSASVPSLLSSFAASASDMSTGYLSTILCVFPVSSYNETLTDASNVNKSSSVFICSEP